MQARLFKSWMGSTHFLTRTLDKVRTEISLHVLAYNDRMPDAMGVRRQTVEHPFGTLKRMITIFGVGPLMAAIRT
jgi:hypothetical protein